MLGGTLESQPKVGRPERGLGAGLAGGRRRGCKEGPSWRLREGQRKEARAVSLKQGFLPWHYDILARSFFAVGACPVHCRMLSSIPGCLPTRC